ncbi:hypothetical protein MTO96_034585, partial [Rhipicephalus appendiculatus]
PQGPTGRRALIGFFGPSDGKMNLMGYLVGHPKAPEKITSAKMGNAFMLTISRVHQVTQKKHP